MLRRAIALMILSGVLICGFGCGGAGKSTLRQSNPDAEIRVYEVFGMNCPGCHGGLNKLVEKIPEVGESEANWKENRLTVMVASGAQLNDEDIYDAIRRANFTAGQRLE